MKNQTTKVRLYISIMLCLLFMSFGVTMYILTTIQKESLRNSKINIDSNSAENKLLLKQTVQRLDKEIKQVNNYFISDVDTIGFIARLEEVAELSELSVDIQDIDVEEEKYYGNLTMTIRASGSWQGLMAFTTTLEKLDKKIVIDGLRLSSSIDDEGSVTWSAVFNLSGLTM